MKKSTKLIITIVLSALCSILSFSLPTFADSICTNDKIPDEVKVASGCKGVGGDDQFVTIIQNILNAVIGISGIVAVIYIVIGGVSYMTSTGDPNKIQKARQTILYAVIGLIICALAFAIVNLTITIINGQEPAAEDKTTSYLSLALFTK